MRLPLLAAPLVALVSAFTSGSAATTVPTTTVPTTTVPTVAETPAQVEAKELSLSQLPSGWLVEHSGTGHFARTGCLKGLDSPAQSVVRATASYIHGSTSFLGEILEYGTGAAARYTKVKNVFAGCRELTGTAGSVAVKGAISPLPLSRVGTTSVAYATTLRFNGFAVGTDFVFFEVGHYAGEILYEAVGHPDVGRLKGFVTQAVKNIAGKRAGSST